MNRALLALLPLATLPFLSLPGCNPTTAGGGDGGADGGPVVNTCPKPTGTGVKHNDWVNADETWKAADSPHIVTFGLRIAKGTTLTIEPCAEVRLQKGYSLVVEGNLVAQGTASNPITIGADDAANPWGFLQVYAPGTIKLAYTTVKDGGGETSNAYGMIEARGDQLAPAQEILKLDHVTVENSAGYGISLREGGALTADSTALTITKSKIAPMRIVPRLATNIPDGNYKGNDADVIVVETSAYGEVNYEDVTYHDRGVPYLIGGPNSLGDFRVGPKHFTLTLEAGVIFGFKKAGRLLVQDSGTSTGVIVAKGTTASPVVFTSAADPAAPGDWMGLEIGKVADPNFSLDHVEIDYAGGPSGSTGHHCYMGQQWQDEAAISIYHEPVGNYVTNSLIAESKADGINNAYAGAYHDFKATNQFMNVAGCQVTQPLPTMGVCPNMGCP